MSNYKIKVKAGQVNRQYIRDLWNYRELFLILSWRDILVRYKQTIIGVAWSVLRPLLTMLIFTFVFGKIAKLPSNGAPYPIMVFSAMLPWQFFSNTLSEGGNSLLQNTDMVSKVYFPRIIIPTTSMVVSFIDFAISLVILAVMMVIYNFTPSMNIIFLPIFLLFAIITSLGTTYIISSLNVKYRDFRFIVPFIVQLGMYISPVGFSSSVIPDKFRLIYSLNPMVGVIDGFRWCILGNDNSVYLLGMITSVTVALFLFIFSYFIFRKIEREFADII